MSVHTALCRVLLLFSSLRAFGLFPDLQVSARVFWRVSWMLPQWSGNSLALMPSHIACLAAHCSARAIRAIFYVTKLAQRGVKICEKIRLEW